MTRAFLPDPVDPDVLHELVALALRAPSAGSTEGWHLVCLQGAATERFWRHTLPPERRRRFRWQGLLAAPVILLAFADPEAYVRRYAEADKAATGLGEGLDAWPTPYWTVDGSMAVMTLLLGAEERGLGALLFAVFRGEPELRADLGVPAGLQLLGAIALGHPDAARYEPGRSAGRARRSVAEALHEERW
jgi:nitroreductase